MHGLTEAVLAALDRRLDTGARSPIALGLSGGGDSMALLLIAATWARQRGRPLLALIVDHRLHPDSAAWTAFAGEAARKAGAEWRALPWLGEKPRAGLPAAARDARHRLLANAARDAGAAVILLAHTADDVLEGDTMRAEDAPTLGHLRTWSPSPVWPEGREIFLLRPLLSARRRALRGWLSEQGVVWLDDPANDDLLYARARARASLREDGDGPATDIEVSRTSLDVPLQADGVGGLHIAKADFPQDAETARRLLSLLIVCAAGAQRPPRGEALDRLISRLLADPAFVAGLGGARVVVDERTVTVFREAGDFARRPRPPVRLSTGQSIVWDGRFEIVAKADLSVVPLSGLAARLPKAARAGLAPLPPAARAALPALLVGGDVRLPRPFSHGPAQARSLVEARFDAAAGLITHERDINPACEGRIAMAHGLQSSYVGDLAPA